MGNMKTQGLHDMNFFSDRLLDTTRHERPIVMKISTHNLLAVYCSLEYM